MRDSERALLPAITYLERRLAEIERQMQACRTGADMLRAEMAATRRETETAMAHSAP